MGPALFLWAWSLILGPGMKMDHLGSLLIGVFTLPPSYPSWRGYWLKGRVMEKPEKQQRSEEGGFLAHNELHLAPLALGEVLERRLNPDTCPENQKLLRKACLEINVALSCKKCHNRCTLAMIGGSEWLCLSGGLFFLKYFFNWLLKMVCFLVVPLSM